MRIVLYICVLLAIGCISPRSDYEYLIKDAGDNKQELIKVLEHFNKEPKDTLKYKAALFLVKNIGDKFSYYGDDLDRFYKYCDSISHDRVSQTQFNKDIKSYYLRNSTLAGNLSIKKDIRFISSNYLIENIEEAFKIFNQQKWKSDVDFNTFCEYILPYKLSNEVFEPFRTDLFDKYEFENVYKCDLVTAANSILAQTSKSPMFLTQFPESVPDFPISQLQKIKAGTCMESSGLATYIMRSFGIPVSVDFTPQWANRGGGHSWCALVINKDSSIDFEGVNAPHVGGHLLLSSTDNRVAKVYRWTYSKQEQSLAMIHGDEEIPALFMNAYFIDVSGSYFKGSKLKLNFLPSLVRDKKYAYLCVFDNKDWKPISWSKIEQNAATFDDLGVNVVYLPTKYENGEVYSISAPVLINSDGSIRVLKADTTQKREVRLNRKYPVMDWWDSRTLAMKGGRFQVSNDSTFKIAKEIYVINTPPEMKYHSVETNLSTKYRYLRYLSADSSYGDIAELIVYDNNKIQLTGRSFSSVAEDSACDSEKAFDKNPLSFFHGLSTAEPNWVALDFGKPQTIQCIKFLGRNDDNFINQYDIYELFFWGDGAWQSLGRKTDNTNEQVLVYDNVPLNALLLLRNLSKGKEERIFTYESNTQKWW